MIVELVSEGGFAYIPGQSRPVRIDTSRISPGDQRQLETLLDQAQFFNQPGELPRPRGAADDRQYTISVTSPNASHSLTFYDSSGSEALMELVRYIREVSFKYPNHGATDPANPVESSPDAKT